MCDPVVGVSVGADWVDQVGLRVAINGFGRIGRNVLRAWLERLCAGDAAARSVSFVAINDVADPEVLLHLLRFDSTYGRLSRLGVSAYLERLPSGAVFLCLEGQVGDRVFLLRLAVLAEADPQDLPWEDLGVDVVLECTGLFRSYAGASRHRLAGASQVIVGAAPFDEIDACVVLGVNEQVLSRDLPVISSVSCTTQALVPLIFTLDAAFGVSSVMMTEIHAVTADQNVLDQAHRDFRRARAAGHNMIPTTSSSILATERVLPKMKGRINGHSIRVPTLDVAAIDVNFIFDQSVSVQAVAAHLRQVSQGGLKGIMGYTDQPLVSSDFIHQAESLVVDAGQMMQVGSQIKVFAWYDNEWGYANRLLDMCVVLAAQD